MRDVAPRVSILRGALCPVPTPLGAGPFLDGLDRQMRCGERYRSVAGLGVSTSTWPNEEVVFQTIISQQHNGNAAAPIVQGDT
jgi:hypothetical protein